MQPPRCRHTWRRFGPGTYSWAIPPFRRHFETTVVTIVDSHACTVVADVSTTCQLASTNPPSTTKNRVYVVLGHVLHEPKSVSEQMTHDKRSTHIVVCICRAWGRNTWQIRRSRQTCHPGTIVNVWVQLVCREPGVLSPRHATRHMVNPWFAHGKTVVCFTYSDNRHPLPSASSDTQQNEWVNLPSADTRQNEIFAKCISTLAWVSAVHTKKFTSTLQNFLPSTYISTNYMLKFRTNQLCLLYLTF
jgi:hypothetical protein